MDEKKTDELTENELDQVSGGEGRDENIYCTCKDPVYRAGTWICVKCGKSKKPQGRLDIP